MSERILVTGASSMLGQTIIPMLEEEYTVRPLHHEDVDLMDFKETRRMFLYLHCDIVLNLATYSGNVQFNQKYPSDTFLNSSLINLNSLKAAQDSGVKKIVSVMSSCCLPDESEILYEENLHKGEPNPTVESHGYAKRLLDIGSRQIRLQYGINAVTCIPQNLFGEHDSLDLNKTKVVMALIKRFVDARNNQSPSIELWGSGAACRQFLYVDDATKAIVQVIKSYNDPYPVNITPPEETSIKELAEKIKHLTGYQGEILWDTTKGDGQLRRKLSDVKMKQHLNLAFTPLDEGLRKTIEWYEKSVS